MQQKLVAGGLSSPPLIPSSGVPPQSSLRGASPPEIVVPCTAIGSSPSSGGGAIRRRPISGGGSGTGTSAASKSMNKLHWQQKRELLTSYGRNIGLYICSDWLTLFHENMIIMNVTTDIPSFSLDLKKWKHESLNFRYNFDWKFERQEAWYMCDNLFFLSTFFYGWKKWRKNDQPRRWTFLFLMKQFLLFLTHSATTHFVDWENVFLLLLF
jgi:hypothetical protein